jgi:prefoldin subunit 5
MGSSEFQNLNTIKESSNSKLQTLESSISTLSSELNNLVYHEISLSNKLETFLAGSSERIELINSKLMLEVQSRTNSLQSSSNIYRAVENLAQKLESLNSTHEILSSESSHLAMMNSHLSSYITELNSSISKIKGKNSNQINTSSLVQIEKQLCSKCQIHLLGFTVTPTTRPEKDGSCTSCQVS